MEAEIRVQHSRWNCWRYRVLGGQRLDFPPRVFKGAGPANIITLDFWPPEMWKNDVPVASYRVIKNYGITTNHLLVLQKTGFIF